MREPDVQLDGWCLESGEQYHANAPGTFWIPDRADRENLKPGDLAKLIFRISLDGSEEPSVVERMWVLVRERVTGGYLGILDNNPSSIAENDAFWSGVELPFQAHHVIDIRGGNERTLALALQKPTRRWSK